MVGLKWWLTAPGQTKALRICSALRGYACLMSNPVNKVWLKDQKFDSRSSRLFSLGQKGTDSRQLNWAELRDRWEYSHVVRAIFSMVSFIALVTAISL